MDKEKSFLTEMYTTGLNLTVSNLGNNITPIGRNEIILNQRQLVNEMLSGLNGQFFNVDGKTIIDFASNYGELRLPDQFANARISETVNLSTFGIYSESQLDLLQPFIDDFLIEENLQTVKSKAISFEQTIIYSSLSENEKIQLLAVSTGVISFAEFVQNGGIEEIQKILAEELGIDSSNARVMGCKVDVKSVAAGAVVNGVLVGGAGLKTGCAGGMVAGPIGAASGCVGGAVMGFATGFMWGIIGGTATSLLTTCFS